MDAKYWKRLAPGYRSTIRLCYSTQMKKGPPRLFII